MADRNLKSVAMVLFFLLFAIMVVHVALQSNWIDKKNDRYGD